MKKISTLTTVVFLAFFAALSARASLIWYEGFQYPNGSLATTNTDLASISNSASLGVWFRVSGSANPSDMLVVNSNLQVCATGGGKVSRQDDCCRYFATTNGTPPTNALATYGVTNYDYPQVLYASFTVICSTTVSNGAGLPNGGGSYFASFYSNTNFGSVGGIAGTNANGYGYFGRVQALTNGSILPNTWRLGVSDNTKSTNNNDGGWPSGGGLDLAANTPYQVVEELDPVNLQVATIWVNPINIYQSGSSPVDPAYSANDGMGKALVYGVNSYAFRQASSFGNAVFIITNLAIATTFAEAATNVWATNAVPPVIAYQPPLVTSNFVGATFSISAVANGQGLANMAYQWQVSASANNSSPVNVSGGDFSGENGNVLTINNAHTGDSGYYTLIATTPYGLSATSSVARVVISSVPVPPSFVTEPVSQTVYRGQTVTLTASVLSPGNVTFTWYSNNTVMVGANISSDNSSSTLTLNNVITNNSAAYKVAVTNDVFPTGIVSTNGVLTVLNPPVVSVAYLRSLLDPNNGYNPTVPPSAPYVYQVTGTVTTFTNLTSGNTSSYYLQDGTGGINIFVTGGSSFRPALGDVVVFVGVLSTFSSGLELDADTTVNSTLPYTSYTDTGMNVPLPTPLVIGYDLATNLNNLNFNVQGSLVQLRDCNFGTNAGTAISTSGNQTVIVTNAIGQSFSLKFFNLDLDTAGQTLPGYAYSVTGVLYGYSTNSSYGVAVTRFADINSTTPVSIPLYARVSGGNNILIWGGSAFSLQSAPSLGGPWTTVGSASSPYTIPKTPQPQFFRLSY